MLRAGRAIVRVEQAHLAELAGVSVETIKRLERIRGVVNASAATRQALALAFAKLGVTFFSDPAGRLCVRQGGGEDGALIAPAAAPVRPGLLCRAIYHSVAADETARSADAVIGNIVSAALERNGPLSVTGALLYAGGRFLQALEGAPRDVALVLGGIAMDPRHHHFTPVGRTVIAQRLFPDWVLCAGQVEGLDVTANFDPAEMQADDFLALLVQLADRERTAAMSS